MKFLEKITLGKITSGEMKELEYGIQVRVAIAYVLGAAVMAVCIWVLE